MALSEWTRYVRAFRDTRVADYSAPGVNTARRIAYHPPIAVSPFHPTLSVFYSKQTLWRCCQLWPYVGMGSLGTRLHRDCNAMGEAAKISPCVPSTFSSRSVGRRWEDMILPDRENPRKESVRPKVGKDTVCIFIVWQDEMKMRCCLSTPGSPEYILRVVHSTSVTPVSPYTHRSSLRIYLEAVIDRIWRCTWRPRWSGLTDTLGGRDRARLEMHLETEIEWTHRCTWRPWSSVFGHALGGRDRVNSVMHSEAVTKWVWGCTCRLRSSENGGVLGGSRFGGRCDGSWDSIHWLTGKWIRNWLGVRDCRSWDDAVLGVCCTRC